MDKTKKLPKGIAQLVASQLSTQPSGQVFTFDNGYLYNNQLYIPIRNAQIKCDNIFITTNGNRCAMQPCNDNKTIAPCTYLLQQYGKPIHISINIEK